jgi:putative ABC transport system substrate-binding protein
MRRRQFIAGLGSAAAWPVVARAQQAAMPVIGFLNGLSAHAFAGYAAAFREGLGEIGYVDGQNATIEFRWAEGQYDRLPTMAAELVRRQVAVISAGTPEAARAAMAATATIPIVFAVGDDAVKLGLVTSLNRPGGNATGINLLVNEIESKRFGLLHQLVPKAAMIGVLLNSKSAPYESQSKDLKTAAGAIGQQILMLSASSENEIAAAFATLVEHRAGGLLVGSDPFLSIRREQLVALAASHAIPAVYNDRNFAAAGGLISYGISIAEGYRQAGNYVGRILKGEKPADLPVLRPTKFEFVINLKTAKMLGLEIPPGLLAIADEVID